MDSIEPPVTLDDAIADLRGFAASMPDRYVRDLRASLVPPADGLARVMVYDASGLSFVLYGPLARVAFLPEGAPIGQRRSLEEIRSFLEGEPMGFTVERMRSSIAAMDAIVRRRYEERSGRDTIPS